VKIPQVLFQLWEIVGSFKFLFALRLKEVINDFFENALLLIFLPYFFIDSTVKNFTLIWV